METYPEWVWMLQTFFETEVYGVSLPLILAAWALLIVLLLRWHPNRHPMSRRTK